MRFKYESAAKLDPLKIFYVENIISLKLRSNGSLHIYIDRFQGLVILWWEIYPSVQTEHKLVTQIVEQIKDLLFTGPCESIKNWDKIKKTFCGVAETLLAHEIGKNAGQTKKAIEMEVNIPLMGSGSNKSRVTGEPKAMRAFNMGEH